MLEKLLLIQEVIVTGYIEKMLQKNPEIYIPVFSRKVQTLSRKIYKEKKKKTELAILKHMKIMHEEAH